MAYAFFKVACDDAGGAAEALNACLGSRRIVHVTKEWVVEGADSFWAFCVEYREAGAASPAERTFGKIDYREVLPPAQFEVFAKLRKVRQTLAEKEGLPAFTVFTNEQLAEIVRRACRSLEELKAIPGLGDARAAKYGPPILEALGGAVTGTNPVPP